MEVKVMIDLQTIRKWQTAAVAAKEYLELVGVTGGDVVEDLSEAIEAMDAIL
jgi:hypothetical protein